MSGFTFTKEEGLDGYFDEKRRGVGQHVGKTHFDEMRYVLLVLTSRLYLGTQPRRPVEFSDLVESILGLPVSRVATNVQFPTKTTAGRPETPKRSDISGTSPAVGAKQRLYCAILIRNT